MDASERDFRQKCSNLVRPTVTSGRSQMMSLPVRASPKGKQIAGVNESQLSDTDAPADSQPEFDWEIYAR